MPGEIDRLAVEELQVGRHVKMLSDVGRFDVHCSASTMGAWLQPVGKRGPDGQIGMHIQNGVAFFSIWPSAEAKHPFAISASGLQVVKDDGTVRIMPLGKIAELVDQLMSVEDSPKTPITQQILDRVQKAEKQRRKCHRGCVDATTGDCQSTSFGCGADEVDSTSRKGAKAETVQFGQSFAKVHPKFKDGQPSGRFKLTVEIEDLPYEQAIAIRNVALNEYAVNIEAVKPYMG